MGEQTIQVAGVILHADVTTPESATGVVIFAHGSGSGRHSERNRFVARNLRDAGLATVLADLLTADEEQADEATRAHRFDIGLLARRVVGLIDWATEEFHEPDIGLFGASTGAAAALIAATRRPDRVRAVVSRGGRPDLAGDDLRLVSQRTLLIVGSRDDYVLDLNRTAMRTIPGEVRLEVVPSATHLFPEPGAMEKVAGLAAGWFKLMHLLR